MIWYTTLDDAKAALREIIAAQDGEYDLDTAAEHCIIAEHGEWGQVHYRIIEDTDAFWDGLMAAAI